jgi:hypothetical protein
MAHRGRFVWGGLLVLALLGGTGCGSKSTSKDGTNAPKDGSLANPQVKDGIKPGQELKPITPVGGGGGGKKGGTTAKSQ